MSAKDSLKSTGKGKLQRAHFGSKACFLDGTVLLLPDCAQAHRASLTVIFQNFVGG